MDGLIFSLLPVVTACLFLGFGWFIIVRKGATKVSNSFLALCITTFFWQCTWAVLFQVEDPDIALFLVKFGYLLIFFLPTSLYLFLTEITGRVEERPFVMLSYVVAGIFALVMLGSDLFVDGYYSYFFGYYPKAGPFLALHILQTVVVVNRGLYITYKAQQSASYFHSKRLRYCLISLLIYFFAAVDYLCNYGIEFYPPGVVFLAISLAIMTVAIVKYKLMDNPAILAATIAHEMRTPLSTIRLQAQAMERFLPELIRGYEVALKHELVSPNIRQTQLDHLQSLAQNIDNEVIRSQALIDVILASTNRSLADSYEFSVVSMRDCVRGVLQSFPLDTNESDLITLNTRDDFEFYGSDNLMRFTLYNLLKNALYAVQQAGKGDIEISIIPGETTNRLVFRDTGAGIAEDILPHIFDDFFSTKGEGKGAGIGLAFCRRVMLSFNGVIECQSELGECTQFTLSFAHLPEGGLPDIELPDPVISLTR